MKRLLSLLFGAALLAGLGGCAVIKYQPVAYDNPRPDAAPPVCRGVTGPLQVGHSCLALVRANQWYSDTGLTVAPEQAYCVDVPPGQRWFDASRINVAPRGDRGSGLMKIFNSMKRYPDADWFALIVAVVQPMSTETAQRARNVFRDDRQLEAASVEDLERCGTGNLFRPQRTGALVLYPNDAASPTTDTPYFYKNNAGQVWVTIQRRPDSAFP